MRRSDPLEGARHLLLAPHDADEVLHRGRRDVEDADAALLAPTLIEYLRGLRDWKPMDALAQDHARLSNPVERWC